MSKNVMNSLYFGDNIDILRNQIASDSIDLVYLDPPFNSKSNYNILFNSPTGERADAQITAFEDTWHWNDHTEREFEEIIRNDNTNITEAIISFRKFLKENDMMAYLIMMTNRLIELHRALKETGSIYLHCDPTASHYLKIVMDSIFGIDNYANEIVWKRTPFAGSSKARAMQYPRSHDSILFYRKTTKFTWNTPARPYEAEYLKRFKWNDNDGRGYYRKSLLKTYSDDTLQRLKSENKLIMPSKPGANYSYKQYLNESSGGTQIDDIWDDINALNPVAKERLGYPTQKPVALLERIIEASSNSGDLILDPFCGCGTTVHAAEKLNRKWIGIDITHLSISLVERRLKDAFPGILFEVFGTPKDFESAKNLAERDKYQFQWWACSLVDAVPYKDKQKGADGGIDGIVYFRDENIKISPKKAIVSVKGGSTQVKDIRDLRAVIDRENAQLGFFVTLHQPTGPMIKEAASAGFYTSPINLKNYSKIQILTIEDLMSGKARPEYPNVSVDAIGFKEAKKEVKEKQQDLFE